VIKGLAILGSTGSIGVNAVQVASALKDSYRIVALSTHTRVEEVLQQARQYKPGLIGITGIDLSSNPKLNDSTRKWLESGDCDLLEGPASLTTIVERNDVDTVVLAVVGASGMKAALRTVELGKTLALANKESLVVAGELIMAAALKSGAKILPIDSEHSAVLQCLACGSKLEVSRVILTASGGPFRTSSIETLRNATSATALKHPTWQMGRKITVDSATLFNKAFELIEAAWLFDLLASQLEVVVHPQSIVHSLVEFVDGSTMAQLSTPDMRTPIQFALTHPTRVAAARTPIDLASLSTLTFEKPDFERFPSIELGFATIKRKGTCGAVLNAANEVAVEAFLADRIRLGTIFDVVRSVFDSHDFVQTPTMDDLLRVDRWARQAASTMIERG